jgi:hypothetical protein
VEPAQRIIIAATLAAACGSAPADCEQRLPAIPSDWVARCFDDGCGLGPNRALDLPGLGCMALSPWAWDEACTASASFVCGDGLDLTMAISGYGARVRIRRQEHPCETAYVLVPRDSAHGISCEVESP